ncbi:MAG TPA: hypothetical protein VJY34_19360 [Roseiarcus sp.]|nr:hypothetical protein [Roseiarcus sp.]
MKSSYLNLIAICSMLVAGQTAAQAQAIAGPNHPAGVPDDYLITPFGYFHSRCVAHLAQGDELRGAQRVIRHADGTSSAMQVCAYPHYRADGERVYGDDRAVKDPNISHAWIEDASVTTTTSYGSLYAEWTVPPTPTSNDGQTLYYFPGLEDTHDVVTIVQPVLGWNSDYASAWGIASWNCCESGTTYEAPPQPVSSGDTILGYMLDTCTAGTLSRTTWDIVTWDLQNRKFSKLLNTSSFKQTFNWAFGGVLEVYNIKQCTDYPSNGTYYGSRFISFNEVGLYNDSFVQIADPGWQVSNFSSGLTPQCSYGGSLPNQVILKY